jgi:hypothetical protein
MCSDREQKSTGKGYVLVFAPEHPARDIHGYVYEHRLMMEKHLGCPLAPGEVVHHRDKRRWNNSLDNLLLCPDQDIHLALHRAIDSHQDRLVAGYEKWLTARAAEGPLRHVATRNQPAAEPPPPAPDVSRGIVASPVRMQVEELVSPSPAAIAALLVLRDRIKEIANKPTHRRGGPAPSQNTDQYDAGTPPVGVVGARKAKIWVDRSTGSRRTCPSRAWTAATLCDRSDRKTVFPRTGFAGSRSD